MLGSHDQRKSLTVQFNSIMGVPQNTSINFKVFFYVQQKTRKEP